MIIGEMIRGTTFIPAGTAVRVKARHGDVYWWWDAFSTSIPLGIETFGWLAATAKAGRLQ